VDGFVRKTIHSIHPDYNSHTYLIVRFRYLIIGINMHIANVTQKSPPALSGRSVTYLAYRPAWCKDVNDIHSNCEAVSAGATSLFLADIYFLCLTL